MSTSRSHGQRNLPPMEVTNRAAEASPRTNRSEGPDVDAARTIRADGDAALTNRAESAQELSARLFDAALKGAEITNQEVAFILDIDESLVRKWRSPNYKEGPSYTQLLRLPFSFHLALTKAENKHFGFGRQFLLDAIDSLGALAVAVNQ